MTNRRGWSLLVVAAVLVLSGCNVYGYSAHIEGIAPGYYSFMAGWVHDPLADRRGGVCAQMYAANSADPGVWYPVDGFTCPEPKSTRLDVEKLFRGPSGFGFGGYGAAALPKGTHTICINVAPVGSPVPDTPLDCADITIPYDPFDHSAIDGLGVSDGTLTAIGWYSLVPVTLAQEMWHGAWVLDGVALLEAPSVVTPVARPDVVAAVGPTGQGWTLSTPITSGTHTLCIRAVDGFGNPMIGTGGHEGTCRTFTAP